MNRVCACDPYMNLKWGCLLTPRNFEEESATISLVSSNKIKPKCPDDIASQTRKTRNPFKEFPEGLPIGDNVILRIHPEERDGNLNYVYFVVQVMERTQKLCTSGRYRST